MQEPSTNKKIFLKVICTDIKMPVVALIIISKEIDTIKAQIPIAISSYFLKWRSDFTRWYNMAEELGKLCDSHEREETNIEYVIGRLTLLFEEIATSTIEIENLSAQLTKKSSYVNKALSAFNYLNLVRDRWRRTNVHEL